MMYTPFLSLWTLFFLSSESAHTHKRKWSFEYIVQMLLSEFLQNISGYCCLLFAIRQPFPSFQWLSWSWVSGIFGAFIFSSFLVAKHSPIFHSPKKKRRKLSSKQYSLATSIQHISAQFVDPWCPHLQWIHSLNWLIKIALRVMDLLFLTKTSLW